MLWFTLLKEVLFPAIDTLKTKIEDPGPQLTIPWLSLFSSTSC
jgi:hypothetical protein